MSDKYTDADHARYAELLAEWDRIEKQVRAEVHARYAQEWRNEWAAPARTTEAVLRGLWRAVKIGFGFEWGRR